MIDKKVNKSEGFLDLEVWKLSIQLAKLVYQTTNNFPKDEMYGITSQMRRAVISISSNIAEGSVKQSKKEFARFIQISLGSCAELKSQIYVSCEIGYLAKKEVDELLEKLNQIGKMLKGLERYLKEII